MRQTPMTYHQQVDLQNQMMQAFKLLPPNDRHTVASGSIRGYHKRKLSRKAELALDISEQFFAIIEAPESYLPDGEVRDAATNIITPPQTEAEMLQEIRYAFGWNWILWLVIRQFVIMVVKWLWQNYHNENSTGAPSLYDRYA